MASSTSAWPPTTATEAPSTTARQLAETKEAPGTNAKPPAAKMKKRRARLVEDEIFDFYGFDDGIGVKFSGYEERGNTGRDSMR